jgi:hypothetical protein
MKAPLRFFAPGPQPPETPESLKEMMIPEILLPERNMPVTGAERLYVAVLGRALDDLGGPVPRLRAAARRYLKSDNETWPLSFKKICEHFNIDASEVRKALKSQLEVVEDVEDT